MKWILLAFVCWYCYRAGQELGRSINRKLYGRTRDIVIYG
jgi:hypothetical protein